MHAWLWTRRPSACECGAEAVGRRAPVGASYVHAALRAAALLAFTRIHTEVQAQRWRSKRPKRSNIRARRRTHVRNTWRSRGLGEDIACTRSAAAAACVVDHELFRWARMVLELARCHTHTVGVQQGCGAPLAMSAPEVGMVRDAASQNSGRHTGASSRLVKGASAFNEEGRRRNSEDAVNR